MHSVVLLHIIRIISPIISTYVINSYSRKTSLLILGGEGITSSGGTTQGDPTALSIYAMRSLPLLNVTTTDSTKHGADADDISCIRELKNILTWWNKLIIFGPKIGCFPKANKSWVTVKAENY